MDTSHLGTHGYIVTWGSKRMEVWTNDGTYAACKIAYKAWNVPRKKEYQVNATLCVRQDGTEVVHTPTF
jgi:hypothetical protein